MRYLAVCFDCDGTLYPPSMMRRNLLWCAARLPAFAPRYCAMRAAYRRLQEGRTFAPSLSFAQREALILAGRRDLLASGAGLPPLDRWLERLERFYAVLARSMEAIRPREGVARTLGRLRESGVAVGVASDFPVGRKLRTLGLEDLVDFAVDPAQTGYLKPDGRFFDAVAARAGVRREDRRRILYVGDSLSKDRAGALAAGMDSAILGRGPSGARAFSSWAGLDSWLFDDTEV